MAKISRQVSSTIEIAGSKNVMLHLQGVFIALYGKGFCKVITLEANNRKTKGEDFRCKSRKRRRRVPEGTQGGADEELLRKDRPTFPGVCFRSNNNRKSPDLTKSF